MLSLTTETPPAWVERVETHLAEVLVDHAHCEKKAAGTAMSMIFAYVENPRITIPLAEIVKEELDHFTKVLRLLEDRRIPFTGQPQSAYGARLAAHVRRKEPSKGLDRCLIAALIEARSCERFTLLARHLREPGLARFYGTLLESEARHFGTYLRLAAHFAPDDEVRLRLEELARVEGEIVLEGDSLPRLHS